MRKFIFLVLLLCNVVYAKPYVIFQNVEHGLFSIFQMVLSFCECYENGVMQGGHLDFGNRGLYYDPEKGPNWWQYYFEPINLGTPKGGQIRAAQRMLCYHIEFFNSRELNNSLIKKYIKVKPHVQEKVETFAKKNFGDKYVIGLHYRGTDKSCESPFVPYPQVAAKIREHLKTVNDDWVIFVATDEDRLLRYLIKEFPNKVTYLPDAQRSIDGTPIHYKKIRSRGQVLFLSNIKPYKNGEDAVLDCLLLARSNVLIRTSSNLSFISTCFNPTLPVILLSERHKRANGLAPGLTHAMLEKCKNKEDPTLYFY